MAIERFQSEKVSEPPPETWSNCLVADNHVYIAGMTARGADFKPLAEMDEYEQAKVCLTKIRHLIEAAGGSMADIVRVNIFVTNIRNREEVWRARREFFSGDFPVSTLVEVSALAAPEMNVEIEAEGVLDSSAGV